MAGQWYFFNNGQSEGPVSAAELRRLAESGSLVPSDEVRREGMQNWIKAGSVRGLFAVTPPIVTPPPLPAPIRPPAPPPKVSTTGRGPDATNVENPLAFLRAATTRTRTTSKNAEKEQKQAAGLWVQAIIVSVLQTVVTGLLTAALMAEGDSAPLATRIGVTATVLMALAVVGIVVRQVWGPILAALLTGLSLLITFIELETLPPGAQLTGMGMVLVGVRFLVLGSILALYVRVTCNLATTPRPRVPRSEEPR